MKTQKDEKVAQADSGAATDDMKKRDKAMKGKKDKKGRKGKKTPDQVSAAVVVADADAAAAGPTPLKGKAFDKELAKLHEKLVKLQEWG